MYSVWYLSALLSRSSYTICQKKLLKKGQVRGSGLLQHPPKNTDKQQKERNG